MFQKVKRSESSYETQIEDGSTDNSDSLALCSFQGFVGGHNEVYQDFFTLLPAGSAIGSAIDRVAGEAEHLGEIKHRRVCPDQIRDRSGHQ